MPLPITDNEKTRLLNQIFVLFAQCGFDGISMDEVAKQIKLSKATMYKYFKSKEDIVRDMVHEMIAHLNSVEFAFDNGIDGVLESTETVYFKGIITAAYITSKFIADLQNKFPDIYDGYVSALNALEERFKIFYELAAQNGYYKRLSIRLVGEQFKMMLPTIISNEYISTHDTTLRDVIMEYYKILLYQILSEEYLFIAEQENAYSFADELVEILKDKLPSNKT